MWNEIEIEFTSMDFVGHFGRKFVRRIIKWIKTCWDQIYPQFVSTGIVWSEIEVDSIFFRIPGSHISEPIKFGVDMRLGPSILFLAPTTWIILQSISSLFQGARKKSYELNERSAGATKIIHSLSIHRSGKWKLKKKRNSYEINIMLNIIYRQWRHVIMCSRKRRKHFFFNILICWLDFFALCFASHFFLLRNQVVRNYAFINEWACESKRYGSHIYNYAIVQPVTHDFCMGNNLLERFFSLRVGWRKNCYYHLKRI